MQLVSLKNNDIHKKIDFGIIGGVVPGSQVALKLLKKTEADYWIADKGYEFKEICEYKKKRNEIDNSSMFQ